MKKILSLILALAMVMSLSVTAFAAETNDGKSDTSIDVNAMYTDGVSTSEVISVGVEWGAMSFTYSVSGTKTWDATKHEYTTDSTAAWTATGNTVTVTNHSNVGIKAAFAYNQTVETVTGTFSATELTLASAEGTAVDAAPTGSVTLTLGGTITEANAGKVGTVTVSIAQN